MKRKYFMAITDGHLQPIAKAYPFKHAGYEFIAHKFGSGYYPWRVTNAKVGFRVSGAHKTRKGAIKEAIDRLTHLSRPFDGYVQAAYNNNRLTIDLFNAVNNPEAS